MNRRVDSTAASAPAAASRLVRVACHAMATRFEVVLGDGDPVFLRAAGEAALAEIIDCERAISPFLPQSSIARVNRDAHARSVRIDPLTFELLEACADLWRATDGAFDPTVGPLMRALGFRGAPRAGAAAIDAARRAVGMDGVDLDPETCSVRLRRPGIELDVGAIGKGHALDLAAETLREHGVRRALLHGGTSTVTAIGKPADADGFRVAIGTGADAPRALLCDGALSVSAVTGRAIDGESHVLDPHAGTPVSPRTTMSAVITTSARVADAWSTALLVLSDVERAPPDAGAWITGTTTGPSFRDAARPSRFEFFNPDSRSTPSP